MSGDFCRDLDKFTALHKRKAVLFFTGSTIGLLKEYYLIRVLTISVIILFINQKSLTSMHRMYSLKSDSVSAAEQKIKQMQH